VWAFNAHIGGMPIAVPLHLDAVWKSKGRPFFDKCFFFESVTEWDSDSEQPNVYDRLFAMLGLDPTRVPAKYKRPVFNLQPDEVCKRIDWLKTASKIAGRDLSKGYIFFQLHATNLVRSLPLELIKTILSAVNEYADPLGISILCADDQPFSVEIQRLIAQVPSAINVAGAITNVRMLAAIIAGANLVIGPDSCALHFAAAFELPALGFWGPFSPAARSDYYPRQIHIFHSEKCPNAPCFNVLPNLPVHKCPQGAKQQSCEVFAGITPDEISAAIKELTR
jgi:ADP-heptose:LPS heptosyltransferase